MSGTEGMYKHLTEKCEKGHPQGLSTILYDGIARGTFFCTKCVDEDPGHEYWIENGGSLDRKCFNKDSRDCYFCKGCLYGGKRIVRSGYRDFEFRFICDGCLEIRERDILMEKGLEQTIDRLETYMPIVTSLTNEQSIWLRKTSASGAGYELCPDCKTCYIIIVSKRGLESGRKQKTKCNACLISPLTV